MSSVPELHDISFSDDAVQMICFEWVKTWVCVHANVDFHLFLNLELCSAAGLNPDSLELPAGL